MLYLPWNGILLRIIGGGGGGVTGGGLGGGLGGVFNGMFSYPNFPIWDGSFSDLPSFVLQIVLWIIEVPAIAFANLMVGIFGGFTSGASASANNVGAFIGVAFGDTESSLAPLGVFAIPVAAIIWGLGVAILAYFIMFVIGIVIDQGEKDVEEGTEEA